MIRRSLYIIATVGATLGASARAGGAQAAAPTRPIAQALATEGTNALVTIAGRATVGAGQLQSSGFEIALQDNSGGVRVL
jgi:hypothetical protein